MDSNRKNYLVPYYDGNNKEFNYRSYQVNIGVVQDLIGFDDVTYLISIDNHDNINDIHIMSYDNKFAYEETILLTEENTISIANYNYICSGKIDNLIKWDNISKSKRIFALFGDNDNNSNKIKHYLIYYNDTFINFTSQITIPYLEKVNYGIKLGFIDIVNQSIIYYLELVDDNININNVIINSLFTNQTIQIKLDGQLDFNIYVYQGTEWKPLKNNNNEGNNDYEIIIDEKGNERVNIKLSAINEFTYCYDRINEVDYEYMNCIIKILEYDPITNETLNIQRLLYHFIKQSTIQNQTNLFNYLYTYFLGYDKDNTIEYSTDPSTIINPYKLTNIIHLSLNDSSNAINPVLFITVDNLTNNMYLISLLPNNQVNINFSDFNSNIIDSKLYDEIQHRRTINSGTNKYVFKWYIALWNLRNYHIHFMIKQKH